MFGTGDATDSGREGAEDAASLAAALMVVKTVLVVVTVEWPAPTVNVGRRLVFGTVGKPKPGGGWFILPVAGLDV